MKTPTPPWLPLLLTLLALPSTTWAGQTDIVGPDGSDEFGTSVTMLPNGNFVVTDPAYDEPGGDADVGAVYLFSAQGVLISALMGSSPNDQVGNGGVLVLRNGNFLVSSVSWDNGGALNAGAVTWGSASTGFIGGASGVVSAANSLVGSSLDDRVGGNFLSGATVTLPNGNYVVTSHEWDAPGAANAGAVTWGNGSTGTIGEVSAANSLVGSTADDLVGLGGVTVLTNGNYVVSSTSWDIPGGAEDVGAATWGEGSTGIIGPVSGTNSLIGSTTNDFVAGRIIALNNGNYVVCSSAWDIPGGAFDVGAVTWCNGSTGTSGIVSDTNSLVGTTTGDSVGANGATALTNGHYVVQSPSWSIPGGAVFVGAATWGHGDGGTTGAVSDTNSLVGTTASDFVSINGVLALTNGNYVVRSSMWDRPGVAANAGAATWGNGNGGTTGPVNSTNSLVGGTFDDGVSGTDVIALTNGNYVVISSDWDNPSGPAANAGAVTWGNGTTGLTGAVSPGNSLVGGSGGDGVGSQGVTVLTNGNYVVGSPFWTNPAGSLTSAGAATWGSGSVGVKGLVSAANSLVGGSAGDQVGFGVTALTNGHYVVASPSWDNPATSIEDVGAATWGNGSTGIKGLISTANSLVGGTDSDQVGGDGVTALTNGHYVVGSSLWNNLSPAAAEAGAATWGNGSTGVKGLVSAANSLIGLTGVDLVSGGGVTVLNNGNYVVRSPNWDNLVAGSADAGAVTLGNGATGTVGPVIASHSVLGAFPGGGENLAFSYDSSREQLIVGRPKDNIVTRMGNLFHSLAKTNDGAPGATDIAFSTAGTAAVSGMDPVTGASTVLCDYFLIGTGAANGKNRAIFGTPPFDGLLDMVLRTGDNLSALGFGIPSNAKATSVSSQVNQQIGRGLFQATMSGTGIGTTNNRLLLIDNGASVSLVRRTGQTVVPLGNAMPSLFREVLQCHDRDLITLNYQLTASATTTPAVSSANDTGILPLSHSGAIINNNAFAREGSASVDGAGSASGFFGQFTGRAAAGLGDTIHFGALFQSTLAATGVAALFRMTEDGLTKARTAMAGDDALLVADAEGMPEFTSFPGLSQLGSDALFRATLTGGNPAKNEGLWRGSAPSAPLMRKGEAGTGMPGGVLVSRIIRFWPAGTDQVIIHAKLSGVGVTTLNNEVLVLRQADGNFLVLLRKGDAQPGTGAAKLSAFSAVEVNPVNGCYAVLGTLANSPTTTNQALWTGATSLGFDTPALQQARRLPQLRLRKGDHYSTDETPLGLVKSMTLKPAVDTTGAGGRGLAQAMGSDGELAVYILGDRSLTELVLLPP